MDAVYEVLNYLTNDNLFTHQLPRAFKECRPWLLHRHPELAQVTDDDHARLDAALEGVPDEDKLAVAVAWTKEIEAKLGLSELDLEPIPRDDHDYRNPIEEAEEMVGLGRVVPVQIDDEYE
jgi:hypothetical protein